MQMKHTAVFLISFTFLTLVSVEFFSKKNKLQSVVIAGSPNQSDHKPFDWKIYDDPSRPEFWDDGADGSLPRPFLHLAGKPTTDNAKKLLQWQKKQWKTIEHIIKALGGARELKSFEEYLGEPLTEHLSKNEQKIKSSNGVQLTENEQRLSNNINWADVRIINIYASFCPACKRSRPLIEKLRSLGSFVRNVQTDFRENTALYVGSEHYTEEWSDYFPHVSTPTYYIKIGNRATIRSDGYIDFQSLATHILSAQGEHHEKPI